MPHSQAPPVQGRVADASRRVDHKYHRPGLCCKLGIGQGVLVRTKPLLHAFSRQWQTPSKLQKTRAADQRLCFKHNRLVRKLPQLVQRRLRRFPAHSSLLSTVRVADVQGKLLHLCEVTSKHTSASHGKKSIAGKGHRNLCVST